MEGQLNTQPLIIPLCWINMQQNKCKQYLELFYTMHVQLIQLYYLLSMKFPTNKQNQQKKQLKHAGKAVICFNASDMILSLVLDAAYLVLPDARSRCTTLYTLTDISTSEPLTVKSNGPVHVLVKMICGFPASASEAVTASRFLGAQEAVLMLNTLVELGHPQTSSGTPIKTDNSTAHDILTAQVHMKRSKAFDMHYHWIKDRIAQGQFNLFWASGKQNCGDYFTKHHTLAHHLLMHPLYLHTANHVSHMRGCVGLHVPYILQTTITCDHMSRDIFPSKT